MRHKYMNLEKRHLRQDSVANWQFILNVNQQVRVPIKGQYKTSAMYSIIPSYINIYLPFEWLWKYCCLWAITHFHSHTRTWSLNILQAIYILY